VLVYFVDAARQAVSPCLISRGHTAKT